MKQVERVFRPIWSRILIGVAWLRREVKHFDIHKPIHAAAVALIIIGIVAPIADVLATNERYKLSTKERAVVEIPSPKFGSKLAYDSKLKANVFNAAGAAAAGEPTPDKLQASIGAGGKKDKQLYTATMPDDPSKGIDVHDNVNNISIKFEPQINLMGGRAKNDQVVYPLKDSAGQIVFTPKANGLKEDIVLASAPKDDAVEFSYHLEIPKSVQARLEDDGSIGFYTGSPELFGNISYGSDADRTAVEKARIASAKNYLMFKIPAPVIRETGKRSQALARFSLSGETLTVRAVGLKQAHYPLSIDPTFLLSTTADFVLGSIDDNIDLSVADQVGRQALVGGSTPGWNPNNAPNLIYAQFASSLVAYNGFLYMMGGGSGAASGCVQSGTGCTSGTTTNDVRYISLNPTTGALGGTTPTVWTQTSALVTARQGLVAFGFNGYLYVVGGEDNSGNPITAASSVEYAQISSTGSVGTWATTGHLITARSYPAGAIYQGVLYVMGGTTANNNTTPVNTTEYARINGDGTIPTSGAGAWTASSSSATGNLTSARSRFRGWAYSGYLYIAAGQTNSTTVINTLEYAPIKSDGSVGAWVATTSFPTARRDPGMVINNGYIYVFGGCTGAAQACASFIADTQYAIVNADGTVGQWQSTVPYNTGGFNSRMPAGVTVYSNHLYFVGGCSAETATNNCATQLVGTFITNIDTVGRYDRGIDTVQTTAPYNNNGLTEAKSSGSSVALNGYMYYLGGCNSAGCSHYDAVVEKAALNADGSLGTFTTTTSLPAGSGNGAGRVGASVVAYNNKLYVIGGTERTTGGTFPAVSSVTPTTVTPGTGGTHNIAMPASVASGDLLLALIELPGGSGTTVTTPAGWTLISSNNNGTTSKTAIYAKNAAGTEGGTNVNFATGATVVTAAAQVYLILAANWAGGTVTSAIFTTVANASATAGPDPPTNTPGWGADDTLWIAFAGGDTWATVTTYPSGFSSGTSTVTGTGTTGSSVASAVLNSNVATENPGAFTMSATATGAAFTIGIEPALEAATSYMTTVLSNTQNSDGTLSGTWSTEANSLPVAKAFANAVVWHNWIYVLGGLSNSSTATTTIYHSQITSNVPGTWTATTTPLSHARWGQSGGIWGNWIYAIGGQSDVAGTYVTAANGIEQLTIANSGDITAASSTQNPTGQFLTTLMGGFVHNGIVYSFGGYTSGSTAAVAVINWASLDSATGAVGTWSATNIGNNAATFGLATARGLTTAASSGGNFYVLGGCTSTLAATTFRDCSTFATTGTSVEVNLPNNGGTGQTSAFTTGSTNAVDLPTVGGTAGRADHAAVAYNGKLYIIGGCRVYTTGACTTELGDIERADIATDSTITGSWTAQTSLPGGEVRSQLKAVAYNGFMYVIGGQSSGANATASVWYTTIDNSGTLGGTWSNASNALGNDLSVNRRDFGIAISRGFIYVVGGEDATPTKQTTVYYAAIASDGTIGSWATTTAFTTARNAFSLVSYNGVLYVVGGYDGSNVLTDVQAGIVNSDGTITAWTYVTDVARGTRARQAVGLNGYMYFVGDEGATTDVTYADVNANGTLGMIQRSANIMNGAHSHGAVVAYNGVIYDTGGCTLSSGACNTVTAANDKGGQLAISRVGHYSKLYNTQVDTSPTQLIINGANNGPGSAVEFKLQTASSTDTVLGVAQLIRPVVFGNVYTVQALNSSGTNVGVALNYLFLITLDDSRSGTFPDVANSGAGFSQTSVTDINLFYHANPGRRLRHGASFTNTGCNPVVANGCLLDTAP